MIIYIHGFGGSGEGSKAKAFRDYFKSLDEDFIAPSLSYIPELAIQTLEELIESYKGEVKLIGSSLGGFYTIYLAKKHELKGVLINPSIFPYETLGKLIGYATSFYDESSFEWKDSHIKMLKNYKVDEVNQNNFMLLVQKGDEVLDYKEAVNKFVNASVIAEEGGSHGYDHIERHFERIREFIC
ncbi:YqiA/YcfP family alpha/beta fold hydrolase [Candidatus Sulfurimonas baltica]|uniref:Esterase n=1 Tax=Candidatus Sulfurimonas baltica TaxID=2740404 RepID=A0A7S7LVV6_9BACT|nr:YqiA/YcfP family alpha/beta fold hydrolase [Candidatus Sulfurimonas baltica]QOY52464.1 esterase [Candidatus Sulfurimonas baltica]